jgi:hypothetical protein
MTPTQNINAIFISPLNSVSKQNIKKLVLPFSKPRINSREIKYLTTGKTKLDIPAGISADLTSMQQIKSHHMIKIENIIEEQRREEVVTTYKATLLFSSFSFGLAILPLLFYLTTDFSADGFAFLVNYHRLGSFQTDFVTGWDGLSVVFLLLTGFIFPSCLILSRSLLENSKARLFSFFLSFVVLMEIILLLIFMLLDLFLFYFCFEAVLIPMFMLIGT